MPKVEVLGADDDAMDDVAAVDQVEDTADEVAQPANDDGDSETTEQEDAEAPEIIVQIGDEEPEEDEAAKAPQWVRDLRKRTRDLERENRELKAARAGETKPTTLGPRPKREDFDFDDDAYDAALETWIADKARVEAEELDREAKQKAQEQAWTGKLTKYGEAKQSLGARDYEDAETIVTDTLSITQQGIIVQGAENAALVTYALGKNPKKAKELAAIEDPIEFAFAVAKLEAQLKVTNRNNPPPPEKKTAGSTGGATSGDATLERLRAEAAKSGDYSKVVAYKREKRAN